MRSFSRWICASNRLVVIFWVLLTLVGAASAGAATKALKQKFSVPGKEGWITNQSINRNFHGTGGNTSPLLPVVTLPAGKSVSSPGVDAPLAGVEAEVRNVIPGVRLPGYAGTHAPSFLSRH